MKITSTLIEAHIIRIINNEIEFLLLKRNKNEKYPNIWQMVTGTIDENEIAYKTALREIEEETSIKPTNLWIVPNINSFYSHEKNEICFVPVFVTLINNDVKIKVSNEHSEFCWLKKDEAKKLLAWPGQKNSVDIIFNYFSKVDQNLKFVEIKLSE
ncbi:MAG: NUDIX domain-containing protein [Melioribacteraceae bacterium]|nr:NUDIX domain-containing protein [Melioribacteraceae bacterium]